VPAKKRNRRRAVSFKILKIKGKCSQKFIPEKIFIPLKKTGGIIFPIKVFDGKKYTVFLSPRIVLPVSF